MSSFSDIQEISYAYTLKQLVEKCNYNFNTIRDSAGPRGKDGKPGETGQRGKRGKSIHFVNYQFDDEASDDNFGVTEAKNAIENAIENEGLEVEVGDIVMFSNCYYTNISSIDEDGTIHIGEDEDEKVYQFRGQRGLTGEQGKPGDGDIFEITGSAISFNTDPNKNYPKRLNLLTTSGSNTLNVGGAIGVFNSETEVGTISGINGFNISSTGDMNLSSNNNIVVKKNGGGSMNIGNDVRIEALNKSIKINGDVIELNGITKLGNNVTIGDNIKFETGSSQINKNSVKTDETTTKTLKVVDNGGNSTMLSITGTYGLRVGNQEKYLSISTTGKITTTSPIECNGSTISVNGTILDTPKFSFSLFPKNINTPANWASFGFDLCIRDVKNLGETAPSTLNSRSIYFKFKIPSNDGTVSTRYFVIDNPTTQIGKLNINFEAIKSNSTNSPEEILPNYETPTQSVLKSNRIYSSSDDAYTEEVLRESLDISVGNINLDSPDSAVRFETITNNISIRKNYHAELLKNMLDVSDSSKIKDMSNTFTRLKSSNEDKYTFVMVKPTTPSDLFVWNFKIA